MKIKKLNVLLVMLLSLLILSGCSFKHYSDKSEDYMNDYEVIRKTSMGDFQIMINCDMDNLKSEETINKDIQEKIDEINKYEFYTKEGSDVHNLYCKYIREYYKALKDKDTKKIKDMEKDYEDKLNIFYDKCNAVWDEDVD